MTQAQQLAKKIGIEWHTENPLLLPEVWDVASARLLQEAGYPLLSTSAAAYAWAHGYRPSERVNLEELLILAGRIVRDTRSALIADLEGCFDRSNQYVKKGVVAALKIGCAGALIGDGGRDGMHQMLGIMEVANRLKSARMAAMEAKQNLLLIARTDTLHLAPILNNPFEETIERANSYLDAGADVVQVGGVQHIDVVAQLVEKIAGPVGISITHAGAPNIREYRDLGVATISLGTGLLRSALTDMQEKAEIIKSSGEFLHLTDTISDQELTDLFTKDKFSLASKMAAS